MSTCAWLSDALVPALTDPDPIHNLYLVNAPRTYMYSCTESNSQQADTDLGMHTHPYIYIYICMHARFHSVTASIRWSGSRGSDGKTGRWF